MNKLPKCIFIWFISSGFVGLSMAQTTLVPYSSTWSYSDLAQEPAVQGMLPWKDLDYNDQSWSQGQAQLGYGDGDEQTIIGDSVLTAYFRHDFVVNDASIFGNLDLSLIYDDGAIVYINGEEVGRINMPAGEVTYSTFATSGSSDNAAITFNIANVLVNGNNVVAVEVHQRSAGSSDISFDFRLVANPVGFVNVTRGPYLQKLSDTAITIKWRTSAPTESWICYGLSTNQLNEEDSSNSVKVDHELTIGGLTPDTRYYYSIKNMATTLIAPSSD
ncbi:MAG: fibronectin type III domain-containing protein, partial [Saprospiraceae bacterium]|nr:fibronectin type III domain-containing protein [Saprospiraceae bacterium]